MPRSRTPRLTPRPRTVAEPLESRTLLSAGDPDPAFGAGGVAFANFTVPGASRPEAVAIALGNKVVVAGAARVSVENPTTVPALARFNADGSPDAGFHGDGWAPVNSSVIPAAAAVQADGKVVTAGSDPADGALVVTRHNADGTHDPLFAGDGEFRLVPFTGSFPNAAAIAVQRDGKIIVAGGTDSFWVVRLNAGGSVDTTYAFNGINIINATDGPDRVETLALDGEGRVLVAGIGGVSGPQLPTPRPVVVRLNTFGRADTTFGGGDGVVTDFGPLGFTARALVTLAGGDVMVAGNSPNDPDVFLGRLNADGSADDGYAPGGYKGIDPAGRIGPPGRVYESMRFMPDGRLVIAAPGPTAQIGNNHLFVRRYLPDGTPDDTFGGGLTEGDEELQLVWLGFGDADVMGIDLAPDGSVVGAARYAGLASARAAAFRLEPDGDPDPAFGSNPQTPGVVEASYPVPINAVLRAVTRTLDGKLLAVGTSDSSLLVARFNADGSLDNTFDSDGWRTFVLPGGSATINALEALPDGNFVAAGQRAAEIVVLRLTAAGLLDGSFSGDGVTATPVPNAAAGLTVPDLAVQPDGKYVVVGAAQAGAIPNRSSITVTVRYNADGSPDPTFGENGMVLLDVAPGRYPENSDTAKAVTVLANGRIVVGVEKFMDAAGRSWAFAAYRPDGTLDLDFGNSTTGRMVVHVRPSEGPGGIGDMHALPDGGFLVAGTGTWQPGNQSDMLLARFTSDGEWDPAFGDNGFARAGFAPSSLAVGRWLDVQSDGKIVVGGTSADGVSQTYPAYAAARFFLNGSVDEGYGEGGRAVVTTDPQTTPADMVLTSQGDAVFVGNGAGGPALVALDGQPGALSVTGRGVFYNHSAFDFGNLNITVADARAVAPDKQALRPGRTASFENVTSYTKGINGVVVQFNGAPSVVLNAGDFVFRAGNNPDPSSWTAAPVPTGIGFIAATGNNPGATRYAITFANYAVRNTWLQVTVKANGRTGLTSPDVFYFGNLIGDTGGPGAPVVNSVDYALTRLGANAAATIDSPLDFDRNGRVNATDIMVTRANRGRSLTLLAPPAPAAAAAGADAASRRRSVYADLVDGA